jgi:hypothetical protein
MSGDLANLKKLNSVGLLKDFQDFDTNLLAYERPLPDLPEATCINWRVPD